MSGMNPEKMRRTVAAGGLSVRDVKAPPPGQPKRNPLQWGSRKKLQRPWGLGELKPVLTLDPDQFPKDGQTPHTQAICLQTILQRADTGVYALRWVVEFGAGAARTQFLIDGSGAQLITVPADGLRVYMKTELLHEQDNVLSYSAPSVPIDALAFFAEGSTSTSAPTYTQGFVVGAAAAVTMTIPVGATSWRITGEEPAAVGSPFLVTTTVSVRTMPGSAILDSFLGNALIPLRAEEIPLPGMAGIIVINNAAGASIQGFIEWEIDL